MKKIYYLIAITLLSGLTACEKFLNETPLHSLTAENAISSQATAKAAIGGIYATFQNESWAGGLYVPLATKSGFINWNGALDYGLSYSEQSGGNITVWTQFYKSLNAANFAISGTEKLADATISVGDRNLIIAEGRCLRAWINANILWNFAHWWADDSDPYGLLYRDEVVDLKNVQKARISVGESYAKIYADLDFAIATLPNFGSSRYVSKTFAKVLKAKLLLYRAGYKDRPADLTIALNLVNDVLANTPATLGIESNLADLYSKAWDSKEVIFGRYLEDDGTRTSKGGYWYTYGIIYQGNTLPLAVGATETAGLRYGVDWFKPDPRWSVVTGPVRAPETWDATNRFTFKKLARLGSYAGKLSTPPDEKYTAYYLRWSELYLLKAELLARTGASATAALAPLNEYRALRTSPALPALTAANITDAYDLIFKEIFVDQFLENGSEYFAALRFKKDNKPWIVTIKDGLALDENHICWPIPNSEIVNNTLIKQNPGL